MKKSLLQYTTALLPIDCMLLALKVAVLVALRAFYVCIY